MILTLFSLQDIPNDLKSMLASTLDTDQKLGGMIYKSILGYIAAFGTALVIYLLVSSWTERYFLNHPLKRSRLPYWMAAQWFTTGFLWFQWLTQDLANIYIYLRGGNQLSNFGFFVSVTILLGLLGLHFLQQRWRSTKRSAGKNQYC
ncbi:MAG: hypothetical protein HC821_02015 [Lewinella sp.]|nr:hypothetical protein [Lewinella sp.]